jgi:hypothetical protein
MKRATRLKMSKAAKKHWADKKRAAIDKQFEPSNAAEKTQTQSYVAEPRRERSAYNIILRRPDGTLIEIHERGW